MEFRVRMVASPLALWMGSVFMLYEQTLASACIRMCVVCEFCVVFISQFTSTRIPTKGFKVFRSACLWNWILILF
jgi:hypothetical protein